MRRPSFASALLLAALTLAACEPPEGFRRDPIVDGTFEPNEDAVVLVTVFGAAALCTGTLIAPDVVLTAKHCVQGPDADAPYPASVFTIGVGSQLGNTRNYRVRYVDTTPGVYSQSPSTGLSGAIFGVDVGVLITRTPVEGVTPIPVRRDRPDDMLGQTFTAIGFGQRPGANAGLKYRGSGTLDSLTPQGILLTSMVICSGDSGGPMIQETPTRQVIGVASFGQAGACPSAQDGYNALYHQLDVIDRALVTAGHCPVMSDEVCDGIDDDCDDLVDEGCAGLGEACTEDTDCAYAQRPSFLTPSERPVVCRNDVCTLLCDPARPVSSCASLDAVTGPIPLDGFVCERVGGCDGECRPATAGTSNDGAPCTTAAECASGACEDPGDGSRRCLTGCRPGAGSCPIGDACVPFGETCGACVDAHLVSGVRGLGEPCETDAECIAGHVCHEGGCTVACDGVTACPEGYRCDYAASVCARGALGQFGDPCSRAEDCTTGLVCVSDGYCSGMCATTSDCPEGGECATIDGASRCRALDPGPGEACTDRCRASTCVGGRCVASCDVEHSCSAGRTCQRDGDGNPRCVSTGGCAVRPGRSSGWPLAPLLVALALLRTRNRSRR
ncbi:MAG: serine protease [Sandaracinaceae bacterium]